MNRGHLARATPPEIDTEWLPLESELDYQKMRRRQYKDDIKKAQADVDAGKTWEARRVTSLEALLTQTSAKIVDLEAQVAPFREEWDRRGGWTRYPFVTNQGGHYHERTSCSTCHPTTQFAIHPATSGKTRGELVEAVGHHACTTCFPEAPTLPSWHRTQREEAGAKEARRNERTTAAREKVAKRVANAQVRVDRAEAKLAKGGLPPTATRTDIDIKEGSGSWGPLRDAFYARETALEDVQRAERELANFDRRHGL